MLASEVLELELSLVEASQGHGGPANADGQRRLEQRLQLQGSRRSGCCCCCRSGGCCRRPDNDSSLCVVVLGLRVWSLVEVCLETPSPKAFPSSKIPKH